ncbi:MAG: sigma-70 family RNA polymerase sigma factor [Myxococcales bacterium]|nr:sigma-70 family RNA polymerase sigma factor [Myxococcales bacterium]
MSEVSDTPQAGHADDVRLAEGCARGDGEALARFDAAFAGLITRTARRFGPEDFADDVAQVVRRRLLVPEDGAPPRISEYRGRGPLAAFVRAVTVRLSLNARRARGLPEVAAGDDALLEMPGGGDDPELAAIKQRYREEFKAAFAQAMGALDDEARNALRLHYLDGLTLADVGALYGWSVPTASRRLAAARQALLDATRACMSEKLKLSSTELDSVLRLIESRLSVTGLTRD